MMFSQPHPLQPIVRLSVHSTSPSSQHVSQSPARSPVPNTSPSSQHVPQFPTPLPVPSTLPSSQHVPQFPARPSVPSTSPSSQHVSQSPTRPPVYSMSSSSPDEGHEGTTLLDMSWDASDIEDELSSSRADDDDNPDTLASKNKTVHPSPSDGGISKPKFFNGGKYNVHSGYNSDDESGDSGKEKDAEEGQTNGANTATSSSGSKINELGPLYLYDTDESDEVSEETNGYKSPAPSRLSNTQYYSDRLQRPQQEEESFDEGDDEDEELMEIQIQTLTGTTFRVRVSSRETAWGLKNLLHRTEGLVWNQQHLLLGEQELQDDLTLQEQGVMHGAVLRLVISLKGGPINARRNLPPDDLLWREVSDIMEEKRDELWDPSGSRAVTLLVLRDGDAVNLYRVMEHEDGSFSPLSQSWGSSANGGSLERSINSRSEEDAKTQATLQEIRAKMEAMKLRSKKKRKPRSGGKKKTSPAQTNRSNSNTPMPLVSKTPRQLYDSEVPSEFGYDVTMKVRTAKAEQRRPKSGHRKPMSRRASTRPSTQEQRSVELRKTSVSRTAVKLDEFPHSLPPRNIYFSGKRPLDDIKPKTNRIRLGKVEEDTSGRHSVEDEATAAGRNREDNVYSSYRQSLVRHAKDLEQSNKNSEIERMNVANVPPRRSNPPIPLYIGTPPSRPRREVDPLYSSQNNFDRLLLPRDFDNRPRTSPEILERRPGSTPEGSRERIQLRDPDSQLMDLMNILNSSRRRSIDHGLHSLGTSSDLKNFKDSNVGIGSHTVSPRAIKTPLGRSFSTMSKPSSASGSILGNTTLASSGSVEQTELLRELIRSQVAASQFSSRRSTPEQSKKNRRPVSGRGHIPASPARLPPVTPSRKKRAGGRKPRCGQCNRRIQISTTHSCRCGGLFCAQHRYAEVHDCTFDYKSEGRKLLQIANPLVEPQKLPKI
ncbi:Ubiquitin domain [Trinorchestia longiramus]|nr:Ubiquitin domain [Trinorchestia longiramus]